MQSISFHNRRVYQSYLHIFPFASRLSYIKLFGKMNVIIWGSSGHESVHANHVWIEFINHVYNVNKL